MAELQNIMLEFLDLNAGQPVVSPASMSQFMQDFTQSFLKQLKIMNDFYGRRKPVNS